MKIQPGGDKLYVFLDTKDEYTEGPGGLRLTLPGNSNQQTRRGVVISVGPEVDTTRYNVGDKVIIPVYAGGTINMVAFGYSDERHKIIGQNEIWAKITDEDNRYPEDSDGNKIV